MNKEIYTAARNLIEDERYWCEGYYDKIEVDDNDEYYHKHCLIGALAVAADRPHSRLERELDKQCAFPELLAAMERLYPLYQLNADGLLEFNDFEGHAAVLAVLDEAIRNS